MTARVTVEARASGEVRLRLRGHQGATARQSTPLSTIASNFKTPRYNCMQSGYGALPAEPRRYTTYARRTTREAAAVLEEKYGENCWFITLTLPGSTRAAHAAIAQWSSYIMARVRQWFRDNHAESEVIAVWELQRRGALHMHMACGGISNRKSESLAGSVHAMWCGLLEFVSERAHIDLFGRRNELSWRNRWDVVQTKTERVQKSISRYLSKYISKAKVGLWTRESYSPTRWWSCSRSLLQRLRSSRLTWTSATMSWQDAGDWFERIGGTVCGAAQKSFAIVNQYKPSDRCMSIWLCTGQVARMTVYRALCETIGTTETWYNCLTEKRTPLVDTSQFPQGFAFARMFGASDELRKNRLAVADQAVF